MIMATGCDTGGDSRIGGTRSFPFVPVAFFAGAGATMTKTKPAIWLRYFDSRCTTDDYDCDCDWDWCEQFQRTARRKRRSNKTYRFDQKYTFFEQQNYSKLRKQRMRRRAQYTSTVDGDSDHSLWYSTPSLTGRACRLIALFMHDLSLFVKFWPKDDFFLLVKTHKEGFTQKNLYATKFFKFS